MIGKALLRWLIGLVAIIAIIVILMLTPIGLRIGLHFASAMLPGKLSYDRVSGVIIGPIEINNLHYTDKDTILSIRKLKFSWNLWPLLLRKITVSHFAANNVHLTLLPTKTPFALPERPYLLDISHAHIHHLFIGSTPNKYPVFIEHIRLNARWIPNHITIRALTKMSKPFPLTTHFNIMGNPNRYIITARTISPKFSWHLHGLGNINGASLHLKEGRTLGGKLSFDAKLKWAPILKWQIHLNGSNLDFKELNSNWPSQITVKLATNGLIENNKPKFTLKTQVTAPGTHIDLNAASEKKLHLKWNANIANLSNLYKKLSGSIHSTGEWTPTIKHFNIRTTHFNSPRLRLDSLQLQGTGNEYLNKLGGYIDVLGSKLAFQMHGHFINQTWEGHLQNLTITSRLYHNWQLIKPIDITLSKTRVTANHLCLKSLGTAGQLCVNGYWNAQTAWKFSANGQHFNPGLLTHFVLPKLILKAPSTLHATARGRGPVFESATANIVLHKGHFRYQINRRFIASPLQQGNINLIFKKHTLNLNSQLTLTKNNTLSASLSIPNKSNITGKLKMNFHDLSPFNKVLKAIAKPTGQLVANLTISGKLARPNLEGKIQLHHGRVFIPRLGITLTKIEAMISSFSRNKLDYKITAYSKDQPIYIQGNAVATQDGIKTATTIAGNTVLIMNTPEYTIYATPKLKVVMQGYKINLTGKVDIPKGIIQPSEFENVTTLPSDQIIYTAGEPEIGQSTWKITANVDVSLGDDVNVKTSGFNAQVSGKATIIGKPKITTLANGRINIVKGIYSAYGKTLTILPGSYIQFINSPVNNPGFNIRATKVIQRTQSLTGIQLGLDNITVGVELRGSFRHPKISFFSIPATLSQADILSYLLLGYASENTSGANIGILLDAANSLGGKGSGIGGAISEIKQGLGLAELGVESETIINAVGTPVDQQTAFVIGKRLTQNIYIRYSLGLGQGPFAPVNIFQLRYTLNSHWAVQTDSSSLGNGADILYTMETN